MTTAEFIQKGCGPNPFVHLPGFSIDMIVNDLLHVLDLSLVPDVAGSTLIELTQVPGVFEGSTMDERLRNAYVQFAAACKQHKIRGLTKDYTHRVMRILHIHTNMHASGNRGKVFSVTLGVA